MHFLLYCLKSRILLPRFQRCSASLHSAVYPSEHSAAEWCLPASCHHSHSLFRCPAHIIAIDIKKYAATVILNRLCLYENAHLQLDCCPRTSESLCKAHDFLYCLHNPLPDSQTAACLHIQVSRTGNKILRIGILAGKLIANKMTAII